MAGAGDKVGGFALVRQLGAGGMGETWEAVRRREHGFEQRVAIKLASKAVLQHKEGLELFRREASLAASLRHPNIAAVLDVDEVQGYLVYELIDGADLRNVLREVPPGRLPTQMLVYILAQIARGLSHAHRRVLHGKLSPVVHRDMSPGNVVVDYDGNLKIVDFGIAKATAMGDRSETIKGKLAYMAPEQVTGGVVDGRVDQYALGVMAYEAVTGVRPNDGAHDGETLANILHGQHIPVTKRSPEIPAGLGEIIERMLAVAPDDRFPTMDAVIDALAAFNPPLVTHRELAVLVHRANPPHTVMLQNGVFVSVPVSAQTIDQGRTLAGPVLRMPTALRPAGMPATETFGHADPGNTPNTPGSLRAQPSPATELRNIGQAATMMAPLERTPGVATPVSATFDADARRMRGGSRFLWPVLGAAAVALLGVVGWAMLSAPNAGFTMPGPSAASTTAAGMDGANPKAPPVMNAASTPVTSPPSAASAALPPSVPAIAAPIAPPAGTTPAPAPDTSADSPAKPDSDSVAASEGAKPATERSSRKRRASKLEAAPAPDEPASAPRATTASIRVRVFPWGRVWIDGKVRGSVPPIFEATLSPGVHEIAAGHEKPMETRKVTLTAGESELVSFDLEGK